MKKNTIVLIVVSVVCFTIIIGGLIHYGYFEYILDNSKIERANDNYSVVCNYVKIRVCLCIKIVIATYEVLALPLQNHN